MPEQTTLNGLSAAWKRLQDAKESRDRWERHVEVAEDHFMALAEQHSLTWTEAVEIANEQGKVSA